MAMRCTHCNTPIKQTVRVSEGSNSIRHALCPSCKRVADEYAIYKKGLFKDLLLFKPEAFNHLVFNSSCDNTTVLILIRFIIILINTLDRIDSFSVSDLFISVVSQIVEFLLLFLFLHRSLHFHRILYITTAVSGVSILKLFISLSKISIAEIYYQMCNVIILLMTSKAISTLLSCNNTTSLSMIISLRIVSSRFFYSKFLI